MEVSMTKILLVEDDKSLREIYGVRLLAEGYQITSAGDGEEALAMAVKERPDLIISDVMMPKISGFDMLDILRSTPETKDIKVIMMTALSSEDQRARGEALGANRYLVKSQVGIEDVVRTVHDVLADSPIAATPVYQAFGVPIPSAVAKPFVTTTSIQQTQAPTPTIPITVSAPQPAQMNTPTQEFTAQQTQATPVFTQPTAPVQPTQQVSPSAYTQPVAPSQMPQPTAPFSTPSPTSLGDRTINPMQPSSTPDIATLMSQELNGTTPNAPTNTPQI
jgi:CheY-like chemotaxis protein